MVARHRISPRPIFRPESPCFGTRTGQGRLARTWIARRYPEIVPRTGPRPGCPRSAPCRRESTDGRARSPARNAWFVPAVCSNTHSASEARPPSDLVEECVVQRRPVVERHRELADVERPLTRPVADQCLGAAGGASHERLGPLDPAIDHGLVNLLIEGGLAGRAGWRLVVPRTGDAACVGPRRRRHCWPAATSSGAPTAPTPSGRWAPPDSRSVARGHPG